jgi:hypothetical protein
MICLIANGRSGTNGLYYNLFKLPPQYDTKEPWKDKKLRSEFSFKEKRRMCRELQMFHIKPRQHTKLSPRELVDFFIKQGVTQFVILKRMNTIALVVSDKFLKKKQNKNNKVKLSPEWVREGFNRFHWYENDCLRYLRIKEKMNEAKVVEIVYEEHIQKNVAIATDMIKKSFASIPADRYRTTAPKPSELPRHARHNAVKDSRKLAEKIENIEEIRSVIRDCDRWMLDA